MNTTRVLKTPEEAAAILEYFNGFHDGFIKQLTLNLYDYFERWGVQACSGRLDLELEIAHYNYRDGEPPADQVVHARFTHVRDLQADMPGRTAEWTIMNVCISGPAFALRIWPKNRASALGCCRTGSTKASGYTIRHSASLSGKPSSTSHARNRQAAAAR